MYIHLKEREYYEDLYDRHTIESGREDIVHYDKFLADFKKRLPKDDTIDRPGNAIVLNIFYMQTVGEELLDRYERRDERISEWMRRDEAKDNQIANARLTKEPLCQHCGKIGLRITDKSLMHRGDDHKYNDPEDVLFMLTCPRCNKNSAFWEDGIVWEPRPTRCPKCRATMTEKTTRSKKALTFTYSCPSCGHSYKDKMDLTDKEQQAEPDSDYEKDRAHYCLHDKEFRNRLFEMRRGFKEMAELGKKFKEKEDNKHIYDAIKELKKPKIAELIPLLSEPLQKAGYIEFHLDKPEMGKDVYIGFSCLDSESDRDDYSSRKTLKKLVDGTLKDTNWRLMSDGISYRLGYLNGRIRAYEHEEDLKVLVAKDLKVKPKKSEELDRPDQYTINGKDGETIIL